MRIIIDFVIPFCFGFIASRAFRNGDTAIVVMAIIEKLADAYDGFPAQVTIKNCRDCTINVYPSQIRTVEEATHD